ncbi:ribose-phosphate diphosphokinase [Motiliproteus sp. MSK22-1]|uniref:ribose-phosphate diphosphokinase n=1 Tax=Motiliproteus sp. MSK22-1 TaxID=1897630 RepID=UPI000976E0EC|nr:ribose-phosphate diphosphokinase [Motiliproteus sp. MSK22-1]OMH33958.1 phosphoribosylpyrophosphate synthetase [Motiliproteus sp. MSK22-1]
MNPLLFNLNSDPVLASQLRAHLDAEEGVINQRYFPDQETYLRIDSNCQERPCIVYCNLYQPNDKIMPLLFLVETLRELGASKVALVTPYLSYMRQDKRFLPGECVNARPFARLLSNYLDFLVTIDPHLHRIHSLDEVYSIPTHIVKAAPLIADWVGTHIKQPLFLGPDSESEQWVSEVAQLIDAPFLVMEKNRKGDRDVEINVPSLKTWKDHTPILVDDIISSGRTMLTTLMQLRQSGLNRGYCIGVHGIFADNAYSELQEEAEVISTSTIPHPSNQIDVSAALAVPLAQWAKD